MDTKNRTTKMKITISKPSLKAAGAQVFQLGDIRLVRVPQRPRKVWLLNPHGEGMETNAAKLGLYLEHYFNREF